MLAVRFKKKTDAQDQLVIQIQLFFPIGQLCFCDNKAVEHHHFDDSVSEHEKKKLFEELHTLATGDFLKFAFRIAMREFSSGNGM